jgi:pimeloyl-ACP methyl ester carboxylesterase
MTNTTNYRRAETRFWHDTAGGSPDERMVHLPGFDVDVRVLGFGEGPPLLFIHGGPNAGSTWAPMVGAMQGFRCMAIDRPGCGLSSVAKNPPKSVRQFMAEIVAELLRELEPRPVGVVASSFGSFAVLAHAIRYPEDAPPAVHMGCPAMVPASNTPIGFLLQMVPGLGRLLRLFDPPRVESAKKAFRQIGHGKSIDAGRIAEAGFDWYAALLRDTPTRENEFALFGRVRPRDMYKADELGQVKSPTSFFWGEDDSFGGVDTARAITGMIQGSALELVGDSGHLPWLDEPERAARHVEEFMGRHVGG